MWALLNVDENIRFHNLFSNLVSMKTKHYSRFELKSTSKAKIFSKGQNYSLAKMKTVDHLIMWNLDVFYASLFSNFVLKQNMTYSRFELQVNKHLHLSRKSFVRAKNSTIKKALSLGEKLKPIRLHSQQDI